MKQTVINYFISENYIPDWTVQDAIREIYQNFIDYGEYSVTKATAIIESSTFEALYLVMILNLIVLIYLSLAILIKQVLLGVNMVKV